MAQSPTISAALLLARGYFPKELPPAFTTEPFAKFIEKQTISPAADSLPAIHNLARPNGQRRPLHLPNPFNYAYLSKLIADNWKRLEQHLKQSTLSVSSPVVDPSEMRAVKTEYEGLELAKHRARVRTNGRFILKTDISRFYSSIYTHSIPWALVGKTEAKRVRRGGWANDLDTALRRMQDGQTQGIPTGPDASFIIGEIVAAAIDTRLQQAGISGMRYIDDYELIFASQSAAEAGQAKLEQVLSDFGLAINERKTSIEELPVELGPRWTAELRHHFSPEQKASADELIDYFGKAFALKKQNPHDPVLAYAVARLRTLEIDDWELLQNLISQCALSEHGAMDALVTHYYLNNQQEYGPALDRVIGSILEKDPELAMGTEVSWALWAAIWFRRSVPTELANKLDGNSDPVVAILALHARHLGLIGKSVDFRIWESRMRGSSLSGPEWLLAYEADIKGWLPSAETPNHVDSSSLFGPLKQAGVSFYNENVEKPTRSLLFSVDQPEPSIFS